jgi:hypothetical protein
MRKDSGAERPLMKLVHRLIAFPALALALNAQAAPDAPMPDRPAAAVSKYKDSWVPVVGADGVTPIAMANNAQVVLETNAGIVLTVGDHYAPGFIKVTDPNLANVAATNDAEAAATDTSMKATSEKFDATVEADTDIPDVYAVMIGSPAQKADAAPVLAVRVSQIGDLQAGKPKHFVVLLPKLRFDGPKDWSVLVFSNGREIRSTDMGEFLTPYFDKLETLALKKRIADRIEKGADAPVGVFRPMPLSFPDAVKAKYHGQMVKVQVTVSPDGRVVAAVPVGVTDADLAEALSQDFAYWMFLPTIKGGAAVSSSAILPLKM